MFFEIYTESDAYKVAYNPFDLTKVWTHKDYPLISVGTMELNRNPENFFAEVEQAAFNPANVVPGIGFSPDKVLQGRLFAYGDAQRYRLGVNHHLIPVNAPRCPVHSYHRDGSMRTDGNYGSRLSYNPNSSGEWMEQPEHREPPLNLTGAAAHWDHREDSDYFSQPGQLFRLMSPAQQQTSAARWSVFIGFAYYRTSAGGYLRIIRRLSGGAVWLQTKDMGPRCFSSPPTMNKHAAFLRTSCKPTCGITSPQPMAMKPAQNGGIA